jgi:hypothetical protein
VRPSVVSLIAIAAFTLLAASAKAQPSLSGPPIHIVHSRGVIAIDGDLSDEGWRNATTVTRWYEISPGDNTEPEVASIGYLAYDDRFLYAAFQFEDPDPSAIRAPLTDHDGIRGSSTDFGGLFIDALDTGRTAVEFFVNPRNVQYDAVADDGSDENPSPDFFWDSASRITASGWTLEIRIPFSTLRFKNTDPQTWGIMLLRNYPRAFRHQICSAPIPRGSNCTVCRLNRLTGLERLPSSAHIVGAPYVAAAERSAAEVPGARLVAEPATVNGGVDIKYTPNATNAVDVAIRPDFSQVESDVAQISANERFALFYPEKRPFFLEAVDLLQTPIQAVYTRTITAPGWGGRASGQVAGVRYTSLVAEDRGGGSVILPGPNGSSTLPQDFGSTVVLGRVKREFGLSFVGALVTDRQARGAGGHNRVLGPDFQWRPTEADVLTGQWLVSDTRTPMRTDVSDQWTGERLRGHALRAQWDRNTRHLDWTARYQDIGAGFRADVGFVPQVGYRQAYATAGWTVHADGLVSEERTFVTVDYQTERSGAVIARDVEAGVHLQTLWSGSVELKYINNPTRTARVLVPRQQFGYNVRLSPSQLVTAISLNGTLGGDIDFANARPARGTTVNAEVTLQPTNHLSLNVVANTRRLNVTLPGFARARLLTERVSRVKVTYSVTPRLFVRVIGQYVATTTNPRLYASAVASQTGSFSGSGLVAYKINWQSVIFLGYGDDRVLSDVHRLEPLDRQLFVKISYAVREDL